MNVDIYDEVVFFTAFMIGFLGSFHCVGMCGFFYVLFFSNEKINNSFICWLFCNIGRIFSYVLIGIFFWLFGFLVSNFFGKFFMFVFKIFSGLVLIFYYLYIKKIFFSYIFFEKKLIFFWKKLFKFDKILIKSVLFKFFLYGIMWGFVPCGLVYTSVLYSFSSDSVYTCFLSMFFFGFGTFPSMLMMSFFSKRVKMFIIKYKIFKTFLEIFVLFFGIYMITYAFLNYGKC